MGDSSSFSSIIFHPWAYASNLAKQLKQREVGPKVYDRRTKTVNREKIPLNTWLENIIMYSWPLDKLDYFGFVRRMLKSESIDSHHSHNTYASALHIPAFVDFYNIDMTDFVGENPLGYPTFNDFFIREMKEGRRPVASPDDDNVIVSAADCRLMVFHIQTEAEKMFIKGKNFTMEMLLGDPQRLQPRDAKQRKWLSEIFKASAPTANFRLSPMDYHRFHAPVGGRIEAVYHISGEYFTVKPKALESEVNVLGENTRAIVAIASPRGRVLFVAVGAEGVGTVKMFVKEGDTVKKGDEIGWFEYGGSDILVCFEKPIVWDEDIRHMAEQGIETKVRVNERIGLWHAGATAESVGGEAVNTRP